MKRNLFYISAAGLIFMATSSAHARLNFVTLDGVIGNISRDKVEIITANEGHVYLPRNLLKESQIKPHAQITLKISSRGLASMFAPYHE